jgi:ornithine carbamoyltransferase
MPTHLLQDPSGSEVFMRHIVELFDLSDQDYAQVLELAARLKALWQRGERPPLLAGRCLGLLFEKPSLRTRLSFEAGVAQLGGTALYLGQDTGWRERESTSDFIRVVGQYCDALVCRVKQHTTLSELAGFDACPIINGLSDVSHPCQALADVLTMSEAVENLAGRQATFIGDGNNVAKSLMEACCLSGMRFHLWGPADFHLPQACVDQLKRRVPEALVVQSEDPDAVLPGSDFVYSDVWVSMGQEQEREARQRIFAPYRIDEALMARLPASAKCLHCMPACRGMEITDGVMDGPQSLIISQAGNRMHAQKGLLLWLALHEGWLSREELDRWI